MSLITLAFAQTGLIVNDDTFTFQGSGGPNGFSGNVLDNDIGTGLQVTQFRVGGGGYITPIKQPSWEI